MSVPLRWMEDILHHQRYIEIQWSGDLKSFKILSIHSRAPIASKLILLKSLRASQLFLEDSFDLLAGNSGMRPQAEHIRGFGLRTSRLQVAIADGLGVDLEFERQGKHVSCRLFPFSIYVLLDTKP